MFIPLNRKGQSTLEYTIVVVVVIAALLMMQIYVKRAVQGKARDSADEIGSQYSAGYTTANTLTNSDVFTNSSIQGGPVPVMNTATDQSQATNLIESTPNFDSEAWPT